MLGGIDLSIQSMASLASVIVALTIAALGYGSFVLAIAIGAIAGLLSGLAHVRAENSLLHRHARRSAACWPARRWSSRSERSITLDDAERDYLDLDHRHAPSASRT